MKTCRSGGIAPPRQYMYMSGRLYSRWERVLDVHSTAGWVGPKAGMDAVETRKIPFRYRERYGTKCGGCSQGISPSDLVRKARDKVFHLNCFTCMVCRKQLSTGEELYVLDDNKFICKEDYISGKTHQAYTRIGFRAISPEGPEALLGYLSGSTWNSSGLHLQNILELDLGIVSGRT
ncbi:hypothetical protein B7P43_G11914 [Cryptotermes secundus]|uniref:LIM zinc-binding domain-containing protein n=1 Tax=Cryptotermes secundus TaxID=105785 RepID=A0A2J7Q6Y1_9NEOP|nr:hypothetical protein B7P43_G11914 [Cryptotermes secundus]